MELLRKIGTEQKIKTAFTIKDNETIDNTNEINTYGLLGGYNFQQAKKDKKYPFNLLPKK